VNFNKKISVLTFFNIYGIIITSSIFSIDGINLVFQMLSVLIVFKFKFIGQLLAFLLFIFIKRFNCYASLINNSLFLGLKISQFDLSFQ